MDKTELHYLTYDPEEIWNEMTTNYAAAGGDILYPGDEKEILLRSVLADIVQVFAGVDNALRMQTLRYAVGDYLDVLGELRGCERITASAATATVSIVTRATGRLDVVKAGTTMTADGEQFYELTDDLVLNGYALTVTAEIRAVQAGRDGNGLRAGMQMQLSAANDGVERVTVMEDAAGGNEREDDEAYRERIRAFGLASVTTGPEQQYEAAAMAVSGEILDANAVNLGAGKVGVYLIIDGDGAEAIIREVTGALRASDVRPLTDEVSVLRATDIPYTLNVQYRADESGNVADAIAAAARDYQHWQDNAIGRAFNPDRLMAAIYQAGAERVVFGEGSNFNGGAVEFTEIEETARCKGTVTLATIQD